MHSKTNTLRYLLLWVVMIILTATMVVAASGGRALKRQTPTASTGVPPHNVPNGEKTKISGRIVRRGADTLAVRDNAGADTIVMLTDTTTVKSNSSGLGLFRRGKNYEATSLLRGLVVSVEGVGNHDGQLVASSVRFSESDLKTAMTVESRVKPVEEATTALSGQVEETAAVANSAKEDAAKANKGVASVNDRITGLDDFVVDETTSIYFPVNKYTLAPEDVTKLEAIATKASGMKGYVIEIAGYADATGSVDKNIELSQRRADSVVRYLGSKNIPPRRIVTPIAYGKTGEADTAQARAENRRVDVKLLISHARQPVTQ